MKGFNVPKNPKLKMTVNYNDKGKVTSLTFTDRGNGRKTFVDGLTLFEYSKLPAYAINVAFALLCYNGGYTIQQIEQIDRLKD